MRKSKRYYTIDEHNFILLNWNMPHKKLAFLLDRNPGSLWSYKHKMKMNKMEYVHPHLYDPQKKNNYPWQDYEKVVNLFLSTQDNSSATLVEKTGFHYEKVKKIINDYFDKTWA